MSKEKKGWKITKKQGTKKETLMVTLITFKSIVPALGAVYF